MESLQLCCLNVTIGIVVSPLGNQNFQQGNLRNKSQGLSHISAGSCVYLERRPKRAQDLQATMAEWNALSMHMVSEGTLVETRANYLDFGNTLQSGTIIAAECGIFTGFRFEQTLTSHWLSGKLCRHRQHHQESRAKPTSKKQNKSE